MVRSLLQVEAGVGIAQSEVITLTTGWNFVALPRTARVLTAEAACEQIAAQGGAVSEIDRWAADVGNWAGHVCGLPPGDFEMTPDEGYFVKSGADSVWRPSGGSGSQTTDDGRRTMDDQRLTHHASRITHYAVRNTPHPAHQRHRSEFHGDVGDRSAGAGDGALWEQFHPGGNSL